MGSAPSESAPTSGVVMGQVLPYSGIPIRSQICVTSSKIEPGTMNGSVAVTSVQMCLDRLGGGWNAGGGDPALGQADEDPGEAPAQAE